MNEIRITKDNFDTVVLQSDKPVLVDFWATWCGPCRMLGPILEKIADKSDGRFVVGKVNIDEEEELSDRYKIMSIPTMKLFKNGEVVDTLIGVNSESAILKILE